MTTQTVIQVNQNDLDVFLNKAVERFLKEKYSLVEVYTDVACAIWGVTERTAYNYVKDGKIIPLNQGSSKYRFRLSDVLNLKK
jgi:hypothetical protein